LQRLIALVLLAGVLLLSGCGQKGVVGPTKSPPPVTAPTLTTSPGVGKGEWKAVACGSWHTLALKQNGTLWAWGLNDYGELGQGTIDGAAHATPTEVGHAHDWVAVTAGNGDTLALQKDGTLWAWGNNSIWGGNLGLGDQNDRYSPTEVGHTHNWTAVSCGYEHTLALKKNGTLWSWGPNWWGGLGTGSTNQVLVPTEVGSASDWAAISGGGDFTLALKKDGTLWACGSNIYGNLGFGDTADRHSPTEVGSSRDWAAISAGIGYAMAIKKDGTLWAWGNNSFGELGLGDTAERHSPTQVGSASDWAAISCLGHHTLALKADGTLWAWGENCYGQLGLGDTTNRLKPTQVGTFHNWAVIALGGSDYYHTLALQRNGTLWAWGFNQFGQLGLGGTTDRSTPTEVGAP
jgi:alpha-tubulin suppressor-like RCC1 family protein